MSEIVRAPARAIVSVGTGYKYCSHLGRMVEAMPDEEYEYQIVAFRDIWPPHSPSHQDNPYAFKVYAIEEAMQRGYSTILWCDSSILPVDRPGNSLGPIWEHIEKHGWWLPQNYDMNVGDFCCDSAVEIMGISREVLRTIPIIIATAFGLDMRQRICQDFLAEWKRWALAGAFRGPWGNGYGEASSDPQVKGHRHDQTMASVVANYLGMGLTMPPKFIAEQGFPISDETILTILR